MPSELQPLNQNEVRFRARVDSPSGSTEQFGPELTAEGLTVEGLRARRGVPMNHSVQGKQGSSPRDSNTLYSEVDGSRPWSVVPKQYPRL